METMKISKHSGKYRLFFWSIAVTILTLYNLTPSIGSFDSQYYFIAGEHLWNGELDCLRTPVYPLLLKVFSVCFGDKGGIAGIIILQSVVYLISVASLKSITTQVIKNQKIQYTVMLLYVLCVAPGWCNEMLTESLSISGCVIITDLIVRYIKKSTYSLSFAIALLSIILVFLRPSFIFLFAILPFLWIVLWIRKKQRLFQSISLILMLLCATSYFAYCKAYEKEYGVYTSSISFVCNDIYNLKRSGAWNIERVTNPQTKQMMREIEASVNYEPIYQAVMNDHKSLSAIAKGCNKMKTGNEKQLREHQIKITTASFDKRFSASVNTKTPISSALFASSLFLSLPLSLFYSIAVISLLALIIYFFQKKSIPLTATTIILFTAAQCFGIVLYASEAHERLLLPVYPLFLVLLGIALEKFFEFAKR